jgi:hypothetical protein
MSKKVAWHTDIVVAGQGIGLKISPSRHKGCAKLEMKLDVPGPKAKKAAARFMKAVQEQPSCSALKLKKAVGNAVQKTKALWNKWHRESY